MPHAGWQAKLEHWHQALASQGNAHARVSLLKLMDKTLQVEPALDQLHRAAVALAHEDVLFYTEQLQSDLPADAWHALFQEWLLLASAHFNQWPLLLRLTALQVMTSAGLRFSGSQRVVGARTLWPWHADCKDKLRQTLTLCAKESFHKTCSVHDLQQDLQQQVQAMKVASLGVVSKPIPEDDARDTMPESPPAQSLVWTSERSARVYWVLALVSTVVVVLQGVVMAAPDVHSWLGAWTYWFQAGGAKRAVSLTEWSFFALVAMVMWGQLVMRAVSERSLVSLRSLTLNQYLTALSLVVAGVVIDFKLEMSLGSALMVSVFCAVLAAWNIIGWQKLLAFEKIKLEAEALAVRATRADRLVMQGASGGQAPEGSIRFSKPRQLASGTRPQELRESVDRALNGFEKP